MNSLRLYRFVLKISCPLYILVFNLAALSAAGSLAVADDEASLLSNTRQLIFQGRRSGEGYFSADGSRMIFQSERAADNPFYGMYLLDMETGDTHRLSSAVGKTTCGWIHPKAEKVLFASTHEDPQAELKQRQELDKRAAGQGSRYSWSFDEHYDIYESDMQGRIQRNLTQSLGYDAEGSWSPDGRLIAFASNRHAYAQELSPEQRKIFEHDQSYFMDIYIMNADGTGLQRLTTTPGYDGGPFFSPDGQRLVWRRFSADGATAEVWSMGIDGSDQRQITHLGVMSWAPYYHPSGEYIVFTNNAQGFSNFELYIVDKDGERDPVRVTYTPGFDGLATFSPDGRRLSWSSARTADHKAQIFIADWNHEQARRMLGLERETAYTEDPDTDLPFSILGQTVAAISPQDIRLHVQYLASEQLQGRLTGSAGERQAGDYVARLFDAIGLAPAGEGGSFFQAFEYTAGVSLAEGNRMSIYDHGNEIMLEVNKDWLPLSLSRSGIVAAAEVVFAGYGIVAPQGEGFEAYDAYAGLDVNDKWVMVLRYLPEDVSPEYRQYLANYFELRYKAMLARDRGVRGLILVNGPNANVKSPLIKLSSESGLASTSIAGISITDAVADRILKGCGQDLQQLQDRLDTGETSRGFPCQGVRLQTDISLRQQARSARNVLARLHAGSEPLDTVVIIGAHIDHIGHGEGHGSLATEQDRGRVHLGADDNASGVGALLEIAQYLQDQKSKGKLVLRHDIIFAVWSGEELGNLGSSHFVQSTGWGDGQGRNPRIVAYLNMDMIGRLDETLYLQGTGSSTMWAGEIERRNVPIGLPITPQKDSYLPTDTTAFYLRGVPILNAFTGAHGDYNTPRDGADKINYQGAAKIAQLMALITRSVAMQPALPDYRAMEKPAGKVSRRNLRAYLGTIPEYGRSDGKGVKLNGVAAGGPAEKGGLARGDIIVELAGRQIENVYDYTYALNALKVGEPVQIVIRRNGEQLLLHVIPASRE
jgi:Tol biopolymer transport system component